MTKPQLRLLAAVLASLIVVVLFAGLDDLPRSLRAEISSEQKSLAAATTEAGKARSEVAADVRAEPELFRVHAMNTSLPARLDTAAGELQAAQRDAEALAALAKANRRADKERVARLLNDERSLRTRAASEISAVRQEAQHWLDLKQHLPEEVAQMARDHQALQADPVGLVTVVKKAEADWPAKEADLESRLAALLSERAEAEKQWQSSSGLREQVTAGHLTGLDYAALIGAAETVHQASLDIPAKSKELQKLSGQLYNSWDKILVDLDERRSGERRFYDEKIRTIRTHLVDVAAHKAETEPPQEEWVQVSKAQYQAVANDLGMAIEHKPAGKYDSEAEHVAQPAGFAYIAPPSQGSNQYGYWTHQGGQSVWTWLPQYLILRDLLFAHDYRPLSTHEWSEYYSARSSGRTYYGHDETAGASVPKYGSHGTFTERRYSDSNYARSGGYRDSRYATGGGTYRGSQYQSRGAQSGQDSQPRTFGRSYGQGSHAAPRSAPPRSAPRGPGRSFGGRRR